MRVSERSLREVWVLQHTVLETLGTMDEALRAQEVTSQYFCPFLGESVPERMEAAGLIVLGGPMGVNEQDRYPFLRAEMRLIEDALAQGLPILGVCLGAQLLASALGAPVTCAPRQEIGWFPLTLTPEAGQDRLWAGVESPCPMFHWHGDRFDLPPGATALASSALTPCQAFRVGDTVYGFQFHLEATEGMVQKWAAAFPKELGAAGLCPEDLQAPYAGDWAALQRNTGTVVCRWAGLLLPSSCA